MRNNSESVNSGPFGPAFRKWALLGALGLAALAVRLACLFQIVEKNLYGSFVLDSDHFRKCAEQLAAGNWSFPDLAYSCPLYPIFLAIGSSLFEGRFFAARILQIGVDVSTGFLVYGIALRLLRSRSAATAAAALYFFYGTAILYAGLFLDTALVTFLYTAFLASLLKAHDLDSPRGWAFCGFLAGACLLIKANLLFFLPCLAAWFFQTRPEGRGRPFRRAGAFFAALFLTLVPFSLKNHAAIGTFSPFPPHGGLNFYIGNNPDAKGYYMSLPGVADQYPQQFTDSVKMAERLSGRNLTPAQSSEVWFKAGIRSMMREPRIYLGLLKKKTLIFWNKVRVPSNINYYFYRLFIPVLRWPWVSFGWLVPTALLGIALAFWSADDKWRIAAYFSVAYFLSVISLFVTARYRFPFVPSLILFACYGFMRLWGAFRRRLWASTAVMASCVVLGTWLAHREIPETSSFKRRLENDYNNLGIHFDDLRKQRESLKAYRAAIRMNPRFADPYYNIGLLFAEAGQWDRAERYFRKAVRLWPGMWYAHYQLASACERTGRTGEAIAEYRRTLEIVPDFADTRNRLAVLYLRQGDFSEAMAFFTDTTASGPNRNSRMKHKPSAV